MEKKIDRCLIVAAAPPTEEDLQTLRRLAEPGDWILCADGGADTALQAGLKPDLVLGDFDSLRMPEVPDDAEVQSYPAEKDDTDMALAAQTAFERGYRDIWIFGGIGSRLDHTFANLLVLYGLFEKGCRARLVNGHNAAFFLRDGTVQIPDTGYKVSIFSYTEQAEGLTLCGMKYPLEDYTLPRNLPLGVSNEVSGPVGTVTVRKGTLLIFLSRD